MYYKKFESENDNEDYESFTPEEMYDMLEK